MSETDDFRIPDKITPEIGWRVWLVVKYPERYRLHSAVRGNISWPVRRELRAVCWKKPWSPPEHHAPNENCGVGGTRGCGIYAVRNLDLCRHFLEGSYSPIYVQGIGPVIHRVFGTAALWGKILAAEHGWRAEYAYPDEIWIPTTYRITDGPHTGEEREPSAPLNDIAQDLSDYGVPVHIAKSIDHF